MAKKMARKKIAKNEVKTVAVPLEMFVPKEIRTKYATNMVVQHTEHEFNILFFEANPPMILGTDKEREETLKNLKIQATCVAKIVVAANRMPDFVQAFQKNLRDFKKKFNEGPRSNASK